MLKHQKNFLTHVLVSLILFFSFQSLTFARTVEIMDTGLNMVRETIELPSGWKLDADIASNPVTGQFMRFKHDVIGPDGEVLRELPPVVYGILTGRSFQQTWRFIINEAVGELMNIESVGELVQNGPIARRTLKALDIKPEQLAATGAKLFEVTVTGRKNNQPYSAVFVFSAQAFDGQSGMITGGIVASPSKRLDATLNASLKIGKSKKMDKKYDARRAGLIDQNTRVLSAQHNRRMQNNQQMFNQNQRMMSDRSKMFDQQNQQWMNNNLGSQSYSSHDSYIDSIHETSTFADPSTGQNRTLDGQYQYNYTDGMGEYYGTDDPSFDPGMMQNGDWQEIQPLQPQY